MHSQRPSPSPCPASQRWFLQLPRPWLTVSRLLKILAPRPGEQVLELGPGSGFYALPVARVLEPGGTLFACDIQPKMLAGLVSKAARRGISNIRAQAGDGERLPYRQGSFDAAYLVTVLHEIPNQNAALCELRRVLKPEGRLVVGEIAFLPTPHAIRLPDLVRAAEAAGFHFEGRLGPGLIFYARFSANEGLHVGSPPSGARA